jgi:tetratricopeptide (TPR) repeat protein
VQAAVVAVIVAAVFAAFSPALSAGFVDWDDPGNFLENTSYRGLALANLKWMATTFLGGPYQPLSWLTLGIDHALWGMDARGYHFTNVCLHAIGAVAFYYLATLLLPLCRRDLGERTIVLASAFAALLFAVHPLRVESVAWITERRDVLSGIFFVLTIAWYLRSRTVERASDRRKWYVASLVALTVSLLSKATGMSMPFVLLALDMWPLRRSLRSALADKIPFLLVAIPFAIVAMIGQSAPPRHLSTLAEHGIGQRIAQASYSAVFYPWKTLVPTGLAAIYDLPAPFDPWAARFVVAIACAVVITLALFALRRRVPAAWTAWWTFLVIVAPTSGLASAGPQLVADRYSYLSCMSFALLAAGALFAFVPRAALASSIAIVLVLATLTWRQTWTWHDAERLNEHTLDVNPASYIAHTNLGHVYFARGDLESAEIEERAALEAQPDSARAHSNLANVLYERRNSAEALAEYERALALSPGDAEIEKDLAATYWQQGRAKLAVEHYRRALELRPRWPEVEIGLAWILATHKKAEIRNGAEALTLGQQFVHDSANVSARDLDTLAAAYAEAGRFSEASETAQRAFASCTDPTLSSAIQSRMKLYAAGQAFHGTGR